MPATSGAMLVRAPSHLTLLLKCWERSCAPIPLFFGVRAGGRRAWNEDLGLWVLCCFSFLAMLFLLGKAVLLRWFLVASEPAPVGRELILGGCTVGRRCSGWPPRDDRPRAGEVLPQRRGLKPVEERIRLPVTNHRQILRRLVLILRRVNPAPQPRMPLFEDTGSFRSPSQTSPSLAAWFLTPSPHTGRRRSPKVWAGS